MLVLSRKQNQRIAVRDVETGAELSLVVVRISGDKVRLGFDAPDRFLVLRDELEPHDKAEAKAR